MGTAATQRCCRRCDNTSVLTSLLTITSREGVWILHTALAPLRPLRRCALCAVASGSLLFFCCPFAVSLLFFCCSFAVLLLFFCCSFAVRLLFF